MPCSHESTCRRWSRRLDIGQIVDEVDLNALLERVDVDALVERTELGSIVARSGAGVAAKALDVVRSLGVGLDSFVHGWVEPPVAAATPRCCPVVPRRSSITVQTPPAL